MTARKRILITALSAILLAAFLLMPAAADTERQPNPVSGVLNEPVSTPQEQYQHGIDEGWSSATMDTLSSKLAFMELTEAERTAQVVPTTPMARGFYAYHVLSVQQFEQEYDYWCGPAVAKQTINFLSGGTINPTQYELAVEFDTIRIGGTNSTSINNYLSEMGYPYANVPTATMTTRDLVNYVATGIDAYDSPPFGAIATRNSPYLVDDVHAIGWHYQTDGHFINISEIYQMEPEYEDSKFYIVDPYGTWHDATLDYYFVTAEQYAGVMTSFYW